MAVKKPTEWALREEIEEFEFRPSCGSHGCPVCLAPFRPSELLKRVQGCGHCFHPLCLLGWLELQPNCPVCRHTLEFVIYSEPLDGRSCSSPFPDLPATPTSIRPLFDWSDDEEARNGVWDFYGHDELLYL